MQVDTNVGSKCHFDASLYYAAADLQPLPRVQYLSANCVLLTYTDGDLAGQLDEHFTKSLSGKVYSEKRIFIETNFANEFILSFILCFLCYSVATGGRHYRNFPPSFWNQNYNRCFRNQLASASDNTVRPSVGVSLQNSMTYFHDTYPSLIRSTAANHSFWTSYAAAGQTPSRSVLPVSSSHASAYGSADGTHFNVKEQTYQHLLGLTKPVAHHHHHHNLLAPSGQYAGLRSDWYLLPDCSNRDLSHHINQSGLDVSTHFAPADTSKELCWF
ncbi:hypothetical protein T4D_1838 [Trichinella pseudospiralis]|uniref:Protein vestigial n=1 Tax=Trichinella pseudospiralis TaxID=6337 RepID=A0A0V1FLV1_TRIPS|nr:hypothetical protein T4D_1838 [Trichinella pseudospiralis]